MIRREFLQRLERGLRLLPADRRAEILADYASYFADGVAQGRREEEVAESLGTPARLAAELLLAHEAGSSGVPDANPSTLRALTALVALVVIEGVAWLPLVVSVLAVLLLLVTGIVALVYGGFTLIVDPFDRPLGGLAAVLLRAVGWMAAGVGLLAVARAAVLLVARLFVRSQRHNRRVLRQSTEVLR